MTEDERKELKVGMAETGTCPECLETIALSGKPKHNCKKQENALKDSGTRREFESGAVRDMSGAEKGRYDLIPPSPLRRLALIYQKGAVKYGEFNWQKGIPVSSFIDSAMRHMEKVRMGLTDEDHAAQAAWNVFGLMWTLEQIDKGKLSVELDDRAYKE